MERPDMIEKLTQQIYAKTTIKLLVEIKVSSSTKSADKNYFAQIWKDIDGIYTIVYCTAFISKSAKNTKIGEVRTFDIDEAVGTEIENLLSTGPFEYMSRGKTFKRFNTQVKTYMTNDSDNEYSWNCLPIGFENLNAVSDIIYKYIAADLINLQTKTVDIGKLPQGIE